MLVRDENNMATCWAGEPTGKLEKVKQQAVLLHARNRYLRALNLRYRLNDAVHCMVASYCNRTGWSNRRSIRRVITPVPLRLTLISLVLFRQMIMAIWWSMIFRLLRRYLYGGGVYSR